MPHGQSFAAAATGVTKSSPGRVYALRATNANAAVRYLQLHNLAAVPTGGEAPKLSFPIPAGSAAAPAVLPLGAEYFGNQGEQFSVGIVWAVSTTAATYTAATAAEHTVSIRYT
jgi:hypothetical protein